MPIPAGPDPYEPGGQVQALSSDAVLLPIGGVWNIRVCITDADGYAVDSVPTVTVTLPAGTTATPTPTVETVTTGEYRVAYEVGSAGRYIARVVATGYGAADFAAYATATTAGVGMPLAGDVVVYMGATSHTLDEVQDALDAEAAAQRHVCRVRAVYPDDLRQALLRRVQRNLAMRQLPLAVLQGDAELGGAVLPGRDPEVRRFEAPHRKLVVG